ncbi:MAG: hypothetical protein AVDCRST_MAG77-2359 [uncultured Chloroflexi bacterium]|uniref:DUF6036 domain-containing protein n=1 Tax=uncultured Chloroflexota bacterium TaxID=166587 RepID=A0A6J4IMK8_9CHLR|nr:MAG: hypothetical protein AVDCRST_MAG77-2359 [uncultured Chloroflexota bacterium]
MQPSETIARFDRFLAERGVRFGAIIAGGTALVLLGVVSRATRDCDVLEPPLPDEIAAAARAFAAQVRAAGEPLADDWLNNGPSSLVDVLPPDWRAHTVVAFDGHALTLRALGRLDLLRSKLFALCDRGLDLGDCLALRPSAEELAQVAPWVEAQDAHPGWPAHVHAALADLARRLGYGV